jgi:hypothetical protein
MWPICQAMSLQVSVAVMMRAKKKDELKKWQKAKGLTSRHSDKAARGARAGARLCARRLVQIAQPQGFLLGLA